GWRGGAVAGVSPTMGRRARGARRPGPARAGGAWGGGKSPRGRKWASTTIPPPQRGQASTSVANAREHEAFLTADYNAEMIGHIADHPEVRDRAIFVGNPDDIVTRTFGPELRWIRDWTERNFAFSGYVTG